MKYTRRKKNRRTKRGGINFGNIFAVASAFSTPQSNELTLHSNIELPHYQTLPVQPNQLHATTTKSFRDFVSKLPDMPYLKLIQPLLASRLFCKDDFTSEELIQFDKYQGGYYTYINAELRSHKLSTYKETVEIMLNAMLKHPLETPIVVYRGSVGSGCKYNVEDKTITDDGFFSTTLTESVSDSFSNSPTKEMCVMEIEVPAGIPHAHLRRYRDTREETFMKFFDSSYSTKTSLELENEVIFPPGMSITINGKKSEGGKTYLKGIASWSNSLSEITGLS